MLKLKRLSWNDFTPITCEKNMPNYHGNKYPWSPLQVGHLLPTFSDCNPFKSGNMNNCKGPVTIGQLHHQNQGKVNSELMKSSIPSVQFW